MALPYVRLQMLLIVALTGATGFATSVALLHSHLDALWLRYPIAVATAYLVFIFFLWCSLRLGREEALDGPEIAGGAQSAAGAASRYFDGDPGLAILLVVLAALLAGVWFAIGVVWVTPDLFAEMVIDVALAGWLYRRLRGIRGDHRLRSAVRSTAWRFAAVAILFCVAGFAIQVLSPGAKSIGQAFHPGK
jgi:hypothetical protein